MHRQTKAGRIMQGAATLTVCLLLLVGCGKGKKNGGTNGAGGNGNAKPLPKPGATVAPILPADAAALIGDDATDQALRELTNLESAGVAAKGLEKAEALLGQMPADDARRKSVEETVQLFKTAATADAGLTAAIKALSDEDAAARTAARKTIADAGDIGLLHLRNMFWTSSNRHALFEAARVISEKRDVKAFPLIIARFRTLPDDPLRYEMIQGLEKMIGFHSGSDLKAADLMDLLICAEETDDALASQMLRSVAAAWDLSKLSDVEARKVYGLIAGDEGFKRRHAVTFLGIAHAAACDGDDQKFAALVGSEALTGLQDYVGKALMSVDPKVKSWGGYAGPMVGLIDLKALKQGLLLYFDFNEELMKNGKFFTCLRDQSGSKVTNRTPRGWLKGVLKEEGSRVPGVRGNGIKFIPEGVIEFPSDRKFREVMKGSYSYAVWIKPAAKPTIAPMPAWYAPSLAEGETAAELKRRIKSARSSWEKSSREKPYGLLVGKMDSSLGLRLNGKMHIEFLHRSADGKAGVIGTTLVPLAQWTHVAGTVDVPGGVAKLYVNGKFEGMKKFTAGAGGAASSSNLFGAIGGARRNSSRSAHGFTGVIDEVRVYTRAISDTEVRGLYKGFMPQ